MEKADVAENHQREKLNFERLGVLNAPLHQVARVEVEHERIGFFADGEMTNPMIQVQGFRRTQHRQVKSL